MKKLLLLLCSFLFLGGSNSWATDVPYTVGTPGSGDPWASRKYSDAYEIAPGETYHFTFTNTNYGANNWNNWLLDCKASADTSVDDWYFTMRADNYGWGTSYNSAMRNVDFVWTDFQTMMNDATVDMYIDYNSTDKIIRTYATITKSETTWHYNFASKAIDQSSVFLFLSEELAVLTITTAEKVASVPNGTYTLYKRTTTTTDCGEQWKADDKDNIWVPNTTNDYFTYSIDGGLYLANTSAGSNFKSSYSASRVLTPNEGSTVSMTAVATMGVAPGRDSSYDYITIGGVSLRVNGQNQNAQVYVDGVAQGSTVSATRGASYTFNVEINQSTGDVTYSVSGGATIAEAAATTSTAISNVVIGHVRGGSEGYNTNIKLTNIDITEHVSYANYTVHFQDNNGAKVKEDEIRNGEVGSKVGANSADKATFIADGNKYVYSSDGGGTTVTNDGSAEFTVTYTKYVSTSYTVKAQVSGSDLTTLASGTAYLDGSTTAYWSKYINVSDQWYVADEATYGAAITAATTNVAFTASDDVDYFFECEDFSNVGHSVFAIRTDLSDASNGKAVTPYSGVTNGVKTNSTISSGVYDITIKPNYWRGGATDYTFQYSTDGDIWTTIETVSFANNSNDEYVADGVVLPANSYLRLMSPGSTPNHSLDYIIAEKTADLPSNVSKTITSAGWATYCSPYILDFSSSIANLTAAYIITGVADSKLTLVEVDGTVPANTGLLLKGEGACTIPVATSSSVDVSGNKLVGVTTSQNLAETTGYVLMGSPKVGFYKNTNAFTLGANTAYLPAGFDAGARTVLYLDEDEAPTAINAIEAADAKAEGLKDGKYLINGRIVMVNNGKAFGANGQILK